MSSYRWWIIWTVAMCCAGIVPVVPAASADTDSSKPAATKAYSPFDEPRPKIPQEITDDKRLDQKVKVFVKSTNMKQLFADLSAKTGVKITAAREVSGERLIIYFHKRPLRDVMTEVSGLYGYRWLISGKPGAYEYQLFEDLRHAARRDKLKEERKDRMDALLMDFLDKYLRDESALQSLAASNPAFQRLLANPEYKGRMDQMRRILSGLGRDRLSNALADGRLALTLGDLSPACQNEMCEWLNNAQRSIAEDYRRYGEDPSGFLVPYTVEGLSSAPVRVSRVEVGDESLPNFEIRIKGTGVVAVTQCPGGRNVTEQGLRSGAGWPAREQVLADKPLPDDPKITSKPARLWRRLLFGDVLETLAGQSDMDVIADYYMQPKYVNPLTAAPFGKYVSGACADFNYTCRASGGTLQFRCNNWYSAPLMDEPPSELLGRLWSKFGKLGELDFNDILEIAALPDSQAKWPGFGFIPGASGVASDLPILRFWKSLSEDQLKTACSDEGLPAAEFDAEHMAHLMSLIPKNEERPVSSDDLARAVFRIEPLDTSVKGNALDPTSGKTIRVSAPSGSLFTYFALAESQVDESIVKALLSQRKSDAEADVIEVLQ